MRRSGWTKNGLKEKRERVKDSEGGYLFLNSSQRERKKSLLKEGEENAQKKKENIEGQPVWEKILN